MIRDLGSLPSRSVGFAAEPLIETNERVELTR
jgi:hypothetical protein